MEVQTVNNQTTVTPGFKHAPKEIVNRLKIKAGHDAAFNAMCYVFAMRERTRSQISLNSLCFTMAREKFNFTKAQYAKGLEFMALLGLGKLMYDNKDRLLMLKDIKVTLQSIGQAALDKKPSLERFHKMPEFVDLPVVKPQAETPVAKPQVKEAVLISEEPYLDVKLSGQSYRFKLPKNISERDILDMLSTLYKK